MNKETIKAILVGAVGSIIASPIINIANTYWSLNITSPVRIHIVIAVIICVIYFVGIYFYKLYRIKKVMKAYYESCFGDSYTYTWEYKKSCSPYSVFGYEPYNIRIKDSVKESLSNPNAIVCGHLVHEDSIKRIILLTLMWNVEKKYNAIIGDTLEYLHYIEDSQKHKLI